MQRFFVLIALFSLVVSPARADGAVLLYSGGGDGERLTALRVALAGHGWQVVEAPPIEGETPLQRAAGAQAMARASGARATLWTERGPEGGVLVRVVDASDEAPRHAPLPSTLETVDPRTFAAVAASLVDELVTPPQRLRVRVQVSVESDDGTFVADGGHIRVRAGEQSAEAALETNLDEPVVEPARAEAEILEIPDALPIVEAAIAPPEDLPEVDAWPIGVDLAPFIGASSVRRGRGRRVLSLGLAGTLSDGVDGVAASAGINVLTADSRGALLAAGANWNHGDMVGVQLAAGANINIGSMRGLQGSTGLNLTRGALYGVQASSGVNVARGGSGAQLGVLNVQRAKFDGVQVGLLNVSRGTKLSLGLVNIVRGGRTHLEATVGADGFGYLMLKHGAERWHSIYSVGGRPALGDDEDAAAAFGLGMGAHFPIRERFALDLDFLAHYLHDGAGIDELPNERGAEILGQLRLVAQVELLQRLALVFGLSLNALGTRADTSDYVPWSTALYAGDTDPQTWRAHLWPSVFVGVRAF